LRGFLWAHTGWFLAIGNFSTRQHLVRDFRQFPELRFLDRFDVVVPLALAVALFALGYFLERHFPGLNTSGMQMVVWGLCVSTVVLYHATFSVNSLAHSVGSRRYATRDDSRNNWAIALLTFGEGWHNNHHYYPSSARQGFFWWEIDPTYYVLRGLRAVGLIWDLRVVPLTVRNRISGP
jgi:stearoyl-CoA desaturase (delta-9 desaturase)